MFIAALFRIIKNGNNPNVHQPVNGKHIVVYPYNRIILNNKKIQQTTNDTCNNMDENQSHYAK